MKEKSIIRKLVLIFAMITVATLTVIGTSITFSINVNNIKKEAEILENQGELIELELLKYLGADYQRDIEELLHMASVSTDFDVFVADKLGYIYLTSNEELEYLEYTKIQIDEKDTEIETIRDEYRVVEGWSIESYVKPVYFDRGLEAYIVMKKNVENVGVNILIFSLTVGILGSIISILGIVHFMRKIIIKPLENINSAAQRLAKGDVTKRVEVKVNDEIGQLAESFNVMAESLEKVDITRKEFISNVSHELRSPITSIKGFIGGMLDGLIPKDKESHYLKIVYEEIDRLSRLVNELLEISSMESGKFNLRESEFDINIVIQTCISNLENKIKSNELDVRVVFDSKRSFVVADRDRIIQVLTNVLDNAVKYGEEKGKIEIVTKLKEDKINISVFNTGKILSKEDLTNIWERFYKTDKSRNSKASTGLGLPIVRLILNQHNQDIWVENVDNKGVKFTFSLKNAD